MPTSITDTLTTITKGLTNGTWILLGVDIWSKTNLRWESFSTTKDDAVYVMLIKNLIRLYINDQTGLNMYGGQQCYVHMKFVHFS